MTQNFREANILVNVGVAMSIAVYIASIMLSMFILSRTRAQRAVVRVYLFPAGFLLVVALYVLPLSLRTVFSLEIVGNISPYLELFAPYIPYAVLLCSLFNLCFALTFSASAVSVNGISEKRALRLSLLELATVAALVCVCFAMLVTLGSRVGGVASLLLYGYRITEVFADAGHLAIAFDWLLVLCILLVFSGFISRSRYQLATGFALSILLIALLVLMGRRAVVVVMVGSLLYAYHVCYKKLSAFKLGIMGGLLFVGLNLVGLLRGDSYDSFSGVIDSVMARQSNLDENSPSWFYVLSSGNFAVPFETLPQVMRALGEKFLPGFGLYSFQSLSLIVPSIWWPERPLPLANWYMENFYGPTPKNEGRQFFFLTEAYMNFGPAGMMIWGAFVGYLMRNLVRLSQFSSVDPLIGTLVALLCASFLNFVAMDTVGFFVVFLKQYGIPLIIVFLVRRISGKVFV